MALAPEQLATLRAHIDASADLNIYPANGDGSIEVARLLNLPAAPAFIVWRRSVDTDEVGVAVNYVAVEAMTDANRGRINTFYGMNPESFDPGRADIRAYWANTFSGALGGQGQATRDALEALWRRAATRAEKLFATGTGSTAVPAVLSLDGAVTPAEVQQARELP